MNSVADKPFTHLCRHGIQIDALRCDLYGGVNVRTPDDATQAQVAEAVAQAFGYHAANILPNLNGFAGYDTVRIRISNR
jgi:hypothetical protein